MSGASWQFSYIDDQLTSISNEVGEKLSFTYEDGILEKVDTPSGSYLYVINDGLLQSVTFPDGFIRSYHYENLQFPSALTGITNEAGVRYVEWEYDDVGRAYISRNLTSDGQAFNEYVIDYMYADRASAARVIVKNSLKKETHYLFKQISGTRKVVEVQGKSSANCRSGFRTNAYSPVTGWLKSQTDWENNVTEYEYDNWGRQTRRTEAAGTPEAKLITTEWHESLNLPKKVTTSDSITEYSYDPEAICSAGKSHR